MWNLLRRFMTWYSGKQIGSHKVGGWVRQRCRVSCVTGASHWYWLTVGQGLLALQQVGSAGECFYFFCVFTFVHFHLFPCPSLSSSLLSLLSLFSLSLGNDTKWPTRVVSLNSNKIGSHKRFLYCQKLQKFYHYSGPLNSNEEFEMLRTSRIWYM